MQKIRKVSKGERWRDGEKEREEKEKEREKLRRYFPQDVFAK